MRKIVNILLFLTIVLIISSPVHSKQNKSNKVPMKHTPIGKVELAAVLKNGHYSVFGRFPSKKTLAVAWAQVALENGQGYWTYNYNLGKITSSKKRPYYVQRHRFRAHRNFQEGAADYWKVVKKMCPKSLKYFKEGKPYVAAQILSRCGYYMANRQKYGKSMAKLYKLANNKVLPKL